MTLGAGLFIAIGAMCFAVVALGLKSRRFIGLTFRSRFIARREQEPWLYWSSLCVIVAFGLTALGMAALSLAA
jgi:hypothetical protein